MSEFLHLSVRTGNEEETGRFHVSSPYCTIRYLHKLKPPQEERMSHMAQTDPLKPEIPVTITARWDMEAKTKRQGNWHEPQLQHVNTLNHLQCDRAFGFHLNTAVQTRRCVKDWTGIAATISLNHKEPCTNTGRVCKPAGVAPNIRTTGTLFTSLSLNSE